MVAKRLHNFQRVGKAATQYNNRLLRKSRLLQSSNFKDLSDAPLLDDLQEDLFKLALAQNLDARAVQALLDHIDL